jgi:omega-amidase
MRDMKVTIIQTSLYWEEIHTNHTLFSQYLDRIGQETDLIVLPEMFTTGFTMNADPLAQDMDGESVAWLQQKSDEKNADIVGSLIIRDRGCYFNRLIWAKPGGRLLTYDKRHLFRMAGENKIYRPGEKALTVRLHGWRIRPFICYDLRFPGWVRNVDNQYDAALFIANWPENRASHWKALLAARAIENQSYIIGVNRTGIDGNGLTYSGDSSIINPSGEILFQVGKETCIHTESLSYPYLEEYRKSFPVWMDAG